MESPRISFTIGMPRSQLRLFKPASTTMRSPSVLLNTDVSVRNGGDNLAFDSDGVISRRKAPLRRVWMNWLAGRRRKERPQSTKGRA